MSDVYRKCQNCGTVNLNRDYCKQCSEIINTTLKRKLEREKVAAAKEKHIRAKKPNPITLFFQNAIQHSNIFIRLTAKFFYSIWVIVIAIGSFLALLFGYIAA